MARRRTISPAAAARLRTLGSAAFVALLVLAALPATASAAGPDVTARILLGGHARSGSWMAIEVHVENDGPPIVGELRTTGGSDGRTRYALPVDLPTGSAKTFLLYADPPQFSRALEIALVADGQEIAKPKVTPTVHQQGDVVVGIVAESPERVAAGLRGLANQQGRAPATVTLALADLPDQPAAWGALDGLVWQDVDAADLTPDQLAALTTWLAQGGHLTILAGTTGPGALAGFPDAILPYRPAGTVDVDPATLAGLVGEMPEGATTVPAMAGEALRGSPILTSGDRVVAATAPYGAGRVAVIGFDPTSGWLSQSAGIRGLWGRLVPESAVGVLASGDDSQLVQGAAQLPSLTLPTVAGLAWLLVGYIVLVGPVNYLVLRRLDRREWAWVTIPALVAIFTVGAFGIGSVLRGSDVVINEVAIVRGGPAATEGSATAYIGVFSPSRGKYDVEIRNRALVSGPISGDLFGTGATALDVVQGETASVRGLDVGFGSLRMLRAETTAPMPNIEADLELRDGAIHGTVTNNSDLPLTQASIALGWWADRLGDIDPGETVEVRLALGGNQFGEPISDQILGSQFFDGSASASEAAMRTEVRRAIINQLTFDPQFGFGRLDTDGPVLMAFGDRRILDVSVAGQQVRRTGETLYYVPLPMEATGKVRLSGSLLRTTVVDQSGFFSFDPFSVGLSGSSSATIGYAPIDVGATIEPTALFLSLNGGDVTAPNRGDPLVPLDARPAYCGDKDADPETCVRPPFDGMPDLALFDRTTSEWAWLPHFNGGLRAVAEAARYVDPASGRVLVQFRNPTEGEAYFNFDLLIEGTAR